ncbi:MAG: class I SAM-dependent methyltransferase, partial [Acidimicrobiales bacterium]
FDDLAPEWHSRGGQERLEPTRDALERGAVPPGGLAIEIGSGIGLQTPALLDTFDHVVSVDFAPEMLGRSPRRAGVSLLRADAASLPFSDHSADAIVCVNAYLFPYEYARVIGQAGQIVFVSTSGDQTPIYLSPERVTEALGPALGPVRAVTSMHGSGIWTVVTRSG